MKILESPAAPRCLLAFWIMIAGHIGPAWALDRAEGDPIRETRAAVNYAWEVYHRAALSGTLQSPALQVSIETELRAARALLAEAETRTTDAAATVGSEFLDRIRDLTDRIINQSQRRKQ